MIEIIKTVRKLFNNLTDKDQSYTDGFRDCLEFFIIGFEKSEQYNQHLINKELREQNAELRSRMYALRKQKTQLFDESIKQKIAEYKYTIESKDIIIRNQREQLRRLSHGVKIARGA